MGNAVITYVNDDLSEQVTYDFPEHRLYIRKLFLSDYPGYSSTDHWHNDIEFIAVVSGEMEYSVNGSIIHMGQGQGIFVNGRQLHYGFSPEHDECCFICVRSDPKLLCASPEYEREFVMPLLQNGACPYVFLDSAVPWQGSILELLKKMHASKKNMSSAPLRSLAALAEIWAFIYENVPGEQVSAVQDGDLMIVKAMMGFIQRDYRKKITLADIAAAGCVGQSKCCRLFAKYCSGRSPVAYLNQYRLERSTELLRSTDMNMTEIAMAAGFGSASYYAETFKKWTGKSPTEYRRFVRGAMEVQS